MFKRLFGVEDSLSRPRKLFVLLVFGYFKLLEKTFFTIKAMFASMITVLEFYGQTSYREQVYAHTANVYRQTIDELMFKSVIFTQR